MRSSLTAIGLACLFFVTAPAAAQLRYCERRSELCWACADVEAGFAVPCEETRCATGQLCVARDGAAECHSSTVLCCESAPCARPPECEEAAVACGTPAEPSDPETCTFLSPCPTPLPAIDAGVPQDAGTPVSDAGVSPLDSGTPADSGTPPKPDSGVAPMDAAGEPLEVSFSGGGGCRCSAGRGEPTCSPGWLLLIVLLLARRWLRSSASAAARVSAGRPHERR